MKADADPAAAEPDWITRAAAIADAALPPALLPRELLSEIFGHARECYPEECCGLVSASGDSVLHAVRCRNVQSRRQAQGESDLGARQAFWIDERDLLDALRAFDERDETFRLVYHSHVDTAAYLSNTDQRGALGPAGEPLYPGVGQLVVSVAESGVRDAALFEWDADGRCFVGRGVRESRE